MATDYYLCRDGQTTGPFQLEQLRSMWQSGLITSDSFYWIEGFPEWKPISEIEQTLQIRNEIVLTSPPTSPKPPPPLDLQTLKLAPAVTLKPLAASVVPPAKPYRLSISDGGAVDFSSDTLVGAKAGLEELKLSKKSYQLKKKELQMRVRQIRQQYTQYTRTRMPMVRGGGVFGEIVRDFQAGSHAERRYKLAEAVQPIEAEIGRVDRTLLNLEGMITFVNSKIKNFKSRSTLPPTSLR